MNREMGFLSLRSQCLTLLYLRVIRGELAIWGVPSRRKLVFGRLVEVLTMMQSCASAAKLRRRGHSFSRHQSQFESRLPATRIVNSAAPKASASAE
jgi:hypothetical protein